jgi:hypothetical protein
LQKRDIRRCPHANLSIRISRDGAGEAAARNGARHVNHPAVFHMTKEELFAALAKKQIPAFATSVLGFTLGSLMDHGVTDDEARALCALLIDQILEAKKNPEILRTVEKFSSLVETVAGRV